MPLSLLLVGLIACEDPKPLGQLVISFETDMALPKDIDTMQVWVLYNGSTLLTHPYEVQSASDPPIPATLTIADEDPQAPVTVRVAGRRGGEWRTFRELVSLVPRERTALMRMPMQWLCDRQVEGDEMSAASTCDEGYACRAGECVASEVDVATLPDYTPALVFGGNDDPAQAACFDTVSCMEVGKIVVPDIDCTIELPAEPDYNVALRVGEDGICDVEKTTCFVPLNIETEDGPNAEGVVPIGTRLQLPLPVCQKLDEGLVRAVYVSTACRTKTAAIPPCGILSSVRDNLILPDPDLAPEPPEQPTRVAALALDNGRLTPCCPLSQDGERLYSCTCDPGDKSAAQVVSIDVSARLATGARVESSVMLATPASRSKPFFTATAANGALYWVASPEVRRTPFDGSAEQRFATDATVYETPSLLVDTSGVRTLVTNTGDNSSGVSLLTLDPSGAAQAPLDLGGNAAVFQFDQDAQAVYVAVGTDDVMGMTSLRTRVSRVVRIGKDTGNVTTLLPERQVMTNRAEYGGYLGVQLDGNVLYALFEDTNPTTSRATIELVRLDLTAVAAGPTTVYRMTVDPTVTRMALMGALDGVVLLNRYDELAVDSGVPAEQRRRGSVIRIANGTPSIIADYVNDFPLTGLPRNDARIYWLNQSGAVYTLRRAALRMP
ncbi:MAG: hypothetical protein ABW321_33975 [Polyangiales bacterium]